VEYFYYSRIIEYYSIHFPSYNFWFLWDIIVYTISCRSHQRVSVFWTWILSMYLFRWTWGYGKVDIINMFSQYFDVTNFTEDGQIDSRSERQVINWDNYSCSRIPQRRDQQISSNLLSIRLIFIISSYSHQAYSNILQHFSFIHKLRVWKIIFVINSK
jgi:hypothetical protein